MKSFLRLIDEAMAEEDRESPRADLEDALDTHKHEKLESYSLVDAAKKKAVELFPEARRRDKLKMVKRIFDALKEKIFRDEILRTSANVPTSASSTTIRPIWIETGVLPRTHGSAVFTRGETQALVTATLGTSDDEQRMDWLEGEAKKRFMMHYNFPPFSVGEVSPLRGPGRREIGHGALAERALLPVIPDEEAFPVHDSRRFRHSRIQRIVLDGDRLRRNAGADGCRRTDQGAGRRRRDGSRQGRRQLRES